MSGKPHRKFSRRPPTKGEAEDSQRRGDVADYIFREYSWRKGKDAQTTLRVALWPVSEADLREIPWIGEMAAPASGHPLGMSARDGLVDALVQEIHRKIRKGNSENLRTLIDTLPKQIVDPIWEYLERGKAMRRGDFVDIAWDGRLGQSAINRERGTIREGMAMNGDNAFADFMTIDDIEERVVKSVNRRAADAGVKWEVANFDLSFSEAMDGDGPSDFVNLSLKVHEKAVMRDGVRRMDLIMQNDPGATSEDVAIDFEMEKAVDVEILNRDFGKDPVFRIVKPAEIEDVISKAAEWLGECEREYEPGSAAGGEQLQESESESAARIVNRHPGSEHAAARAERVINAEIEKGRGEGAVPDSFREAVDDVDAVLDNFKSGLDREIWIGQDAEPATDDPDGPWVATGIIIHFAGVFEIRPDVRTLGDVETVLKTLVQIGSGNGASASKANFQ